MKVSGNIALMLPIHLLDIVTNAAWQHSWCKSVIPGKNLTLIGAFCSQRFENIAIGRSRTSMCYATPGHPVQCAAQAHKRILSVFV